MEFRVPHQKDWWIYCLQELKSKIFWVRNVEGALVFVYHLTQIVMYVKRKLQLGCVCEIISQSLGASALKKQCPGADILLVTSSANSKLFCAIRI